MGANGSQEPVQDPDKWNARITMQQTARMKNGLDEAVSGRRKGSYPEDQRLR